MSRYKFIISILIIFSIIFTAGCSTKQKSSQEKGGTIVIALNKDSIVTLDPADYRDRETETVLRNIFDGLVTRTYDGKVVPEIAQSWEIISPTEWEFKIRKGVTFQNGDPLTADDVVFTFNRIIKDGGLEGKTSPRKGLMGPVEDVKKIDDYTVRFILKEPFPVLLQALVHQQIIPKKYYEEVGYEEFLKHPIGAGPFKYVSGKLDEQIILERYDGYYGGSPDIPPVGPPSLERVVFRMIPEPSTAIAALEKGEVNIVQYIPSDMIDKLKNNKNVQVKENEGTRVYILEINNKMSPFDNPKVRQALNYAIDMNSIVKEIYRGYGVRLSGPMLPYAFAANTDLKPYEYNPDKAKELLKEAGVSDLKVVIDTQPFREGEALAIANMLEKVGIKSSVRTWEWGVLQSEIQKGTRQLYLTDWGNAYLDPFDFLNPKLKTGERGNFSFYSNKEVDKLLDEAAKETDNAKRKELYYRAQDIIYDDAPWVFGYSLKTVEAATKNVENWQPSMDGRENMHRVKLSNE